MSPQDSTRRNPQEIFVEVANNARDELERSSSALAFAGLAGGLGMGLTGLSVASVEALLGPGGTHQFIALLFYPIGFISVVIGRAQLFTENTLYPVALVLDERRHLLNTLRLWAVVFVTNVLGALLFALIAVKTDALPPAIRDALATLGQTALQGTNAHIFWSGVVGGWIIALMAWIVSASHWTSGQVAIIWLLTAIVGFGHFSHCIASSGEILSAVVAGHSTYPHYLLWLALATSGNIVGGVVFVTLLNFGQVKESLLEAESTVVSKQLDRAA